MTFVENIQQHVDAAYPIILVRTHEEDRAVEALRSVDGVRSVRTWTLAAKKWVEEPSGTSTGGSSTGPAADGAAAVAALAGLPDESLYVLKDFHACWSAPVVRALRDALPALKRRRKTVVLLGPVAAVPVELERDVASVDFDPPDRAALDAVVARVVADAEKTGGAAPAMPSRARVLDVLRGLTDAEAESALSLALARHGDLDDAAVATIRAEKAAALRRSGLVEWVEPSVGLDDVGGLGNLKRYARRIAPVFHDPEAARAFGLLPEDFPRVLALVGMPGCGKSLAAEAIPVILKVGLVKTDFGALFGAGGGKVGAAEAAATDRNRLVEAQAPVVDWWDEAEKGLAGASGASTANPWEARVAGTMLTWTERYRVPVFIVPTINRQDLLPPEMYSRFQKVMYVGFPDRAARREIWLIHLGKRGLGQFALERGWDLADATAGYNGREIRNAVQAEMQAAFAVKQSPSFDGLVGAARAITPVSVARADELKRVEAWARENNIEDADAPDEADAADADDRPARRAVRRKA